MGAIQPRIHAKITYAPGIELTPMQRLFVTELTRNGLTPTSAARKAGYAKPESAGYDVSRLPHVAAAIRLERERYVSGELANVATGTLKAIMLDAKAPAAARVSAARAVLEMSRDLGKAKADPDADRPLSEMSADELAQLIDKWTSEKAQLATPIPANEVEILDSAQAMAQVEPQTRTRP